MFKFRRFFGDLKVKLLNPYKTVVSHLKLLLSSRTVWKADRQRLVAMGEFDT